MAEFTGGCLCGNVRYEVDGDIFRTGNCHCQNCKKTTGSAFATNLFVKMDDFKLTKGEPKQVQHATDSGSTMNKFFCSDCGSPIYGYSDRMSHMRVVKAGSIDDPSFVAPTADIFLAERIPGVALSDETDHHDLMLPPPPK